MNIKLLAGKIYAHKYGRWMLHLLFWLFIFAARCYISTISFNLIKVYPKGMMWFNFYATVSTAFAYYSLVYIIYEKLFKIRKYVAGIAAVIAWLIAYTYIDYLFELLMLKDEVWKALMIKNNSEYFTYINNGVLNILLSRIATLGILYQLFLVLALPLFIKIVIAYTREQIQFIELAKQNVQLEFNFLKSQVNPHFLFNTLNNIYSMILHDKKEKSADTVARLSAFMRYTLHDAAAEKTAIDKEIKLMTDYLELEKIRLNYTAVQANFTTDRNDYQLPPLLFIPMLENAFKYCTDKKDAVIDVFLSIVDSQLKFVCSNNFDIDVVTLQKGGIGLRNVYKRLEQYYPGKYSYAVSKEDGVYSVNLSVNLI